MDFDMSGLGLFVVLGLVNWIATEVVVNSVLCKEVREFVVRLGERVGKRRPWLGEKIRYFIGCALCVGVWIGLLQALFFDGPLSIEIGWLAWVAWIPATIANGFAYKGLGHLLLQVNAWFHFKVELNKQLAQQAQLQVEMLKSDQPRSTN